MDAVWIERMRWMYQKTYDYLDKGASSLHSLGMDALGNFTDAELRNVTQSVAYVLVGRYLVGEPVKNEFVKCRID